jgi:pantoate--beta-alanine ligase
MKIIKRASEIIEISKKLKLQNKKISFVPTMGGLHFGHLSLLKKAKENSDIVICSIYVNKDQFNDAKDFEKYPRNLEDDLQKIKDCCQIDYVFVPEFEEMNNFHLSKNYQPNPQYLNILCDKNRKGHFQGVVKILAKFFTIIKPDIAIFGEKDFQQLQIVKSLANEMNAKMNEEINFNLEIISGDIVREKNGLAMSSRNQLLSNKAKKISGNISQILHETRGEILLQKNINIDEIISNKSQKLLKLGFEKIDYFEVRADEDLQIITDFSSNRNSRILIALYIEKIRLIDNLKIIN